jgi:STE24 endopeptidase
MDAMGRNWWLYVWLVWLATNLLILFLYPTVIAPLFNKFTPLEDASLKERIEALLARCGFASSGLFVMDGSKRSAHGNAYFRGFGRAKRIVFFDTLLEKLTPEEIEAVLAHELGHFHHRHVLKLFALSGVMTLAFLWLLGQLIDQPWFYEGLGVDAGGTAMGLLLFSMVLPVFLFSLAPLTSALSRKYEYEADAYAAKQTAAADLIAALVKLYRDNAATLTPDPLHSLFHDSHPPASQRIARLHNA